MPDRSHFKSNKEYNAWFREYRRKNRKKLREYTRNYNKEWRRKNGYAAEERSQKKFPLKVAARKMLRYAVRTGKIKRGNCEICGKRRADAHHEDYYKPLMVRWFCALHHRQHHKHP